MSATNVTSSRDKLFNTDPIIGDRFKIQYRPIIDYAFKIKFLDMNNGLVSDPT